MKTDTIEIRRVDLSPVAGPSLRVFYRDGTGTMHVDWPGEKLVAAIQDRGGTLWVDIENPDGNSTEQAESLLGTVFGFHPLAVEAALQESHLPKIDDWGDYVYLVFHGTSVDPR